MKDKTTYKVSVNQKYEWLLKPEAAKELDIIRQADGAWHLLHQNKSYPVKVLNIDRQNRSVELEIKGENFRVQIADPLQQLIEKMGLTSRPHHQSGDVLAPMPGLVLSIQVEEGETIEKDQALIILEAMKMENIIKAEGRGKVSRIAVKKGQAVNKGELLLRIE